ncbi:gas vesicle protein [Streptomyces sp. NPDC085529]|uniref:gas vesicle protein n=1 Tax=Streptomyces sp. NPDC085529 TaxID=3365729 RepID=UPI0037D270BC
MTSAQDRDPALPGRQVALVDLLDRLLAGGVVITGDIILSIADIDLVRISLRALVSSVTTTDDRPPTRPPTGPPTREGEQPHAP